MPNGLLKRFVPIVKRGATLLSAKGKDALMGALTSRFLGSLLTKGIIVAVAKEALEITVIDGISVFHLTKKTDMVVDVYESERFGLALFFPVNDEGKSQVAVLTPESNARFGCYVTFAPEAPKVREQLWARGCSGIARMTIAGLITESPPVE